jgi:hypothetical protein
MYTCVFYARLARAPPERHTHLGGLGIEFLGDRGVGVFEIFQERRRDREEVDARERLDLADLWGELAR